MEILTLSDSDYSALRDARSVVDDALVPTVVIVSPDGSDPSTGRALPGGIRPWIVLSEPRGDDQPIGHVDATALEGLVDLKDLISAVGTHPRAATALVLLQRGAPGRSIEDGLIAESSTYSMLLAGGEFSRWRTAHPPRTAPDLDRPPIVTRRTGNTLEIELNRADVHNALDAAMRDALVGALEGALGSDEHLVIKGRGATFCAGGDLSEFGSFEDPSGAHRLRLAMSLGALVDQLGDRITFRLHGACRGSGVEVPAFARHVVAEVATTFALPEVSMGLVPGAGGTVSLTRRIGRVRTTSLALTGAIFDAPRALEWGLVDEIAPR